MHAVECPRPKFVGSFSRPPGGPVKRAAQALLHLQIGDEEIIRRRMHTPARMLHITSAAAAAIHCRDLVDGCKSARMILE